MFKRLKYVSRFSQALTRSEIEAIVQRAAANNRSLGVTGVMMASGGVFFQVLEGPAAVVDALYQKISADPRHTDVVCLRNETEREERLFGEWSMKLIDLEREAKLRATPIRQGLHEIAELQGRLGELSSAVEKEVWDAMHAITENRFSSERH